MRLNRVVITGMGAVTPFGEGVDRLVSGLESGDSAVAVVDEWGDMGGLSCQVAALVPDFNPRQIDRHLRRSMAPTAMYGVVAAQSAAEEAGLDSEALASTRVGVSFGSTTGSPAAHAEFFSDLYEHKSIEGLRSMYLFRSMSHTVAANVALSLGARGRLMASSVACASSTQSIGLAFEAIRMGRADIMICGGADEAHLTTACSFALIQAASTGYNDSPTATPRPFDRDRDGVVCGEGGGALVLERYDFAVARGATILAEVLGFDTTADGSFIAHPNHQSMADCMQSAIDDANLKPEDVEYVNAHATGTESGDIAEAKAVVSVLGEGIPVSGFKGHIGHTLGGCGAIELIGAIDCMRRGRLLPTRNLENIDEQCLGPDHVTETRETSARVMLKNSFALGGVNSALAVRIEALSN